MSGAVQNGPALKVQEGRPAGGLDLAVKLASYLAVVPFTTP